MKKVFLTFILGALLPFAIMAQSGITEPGATEPNQLYTTTYDNPGGPNHAPGGPNRIGGSGGDNMPDPGNGPADGSPIGAPWVLLGFAVVYGATCLLRKKKA